MEMAYVAIPYTETNTPVLLLGAIDADRSVTVRASADLALGNADDVSPSGTLIGFQLLYPSTIEFRLESGNDLWVSGGGPACSLSYISTSAE